MKVKCRKRIALMRQASAAHRLELALEHGSCPRPDARRTPSMHHGILNTGLLAWENKVQLDFTRGKAHVQRALRVVQWQAADECPNTHEF
jgi:hypothetical protein